MLRLLNEYNNTRIYLNIMVTIAVGNFLRKRARVVIAAALILVSKISVRKFPRIYLCGLSRPPRQIVLHTLYIARGAPPLQRPF
jgi:hypothetical protein